jgi:hypothetical protein
LRNAADAWRIYKKIERRRKIYEIPNTTQIPEKGGQNPICDPFPEFGIFG